MREGTKLHFYMTGQREEWNVSQTYISAGYQHQPSPPRSDPLEEQISSHIVIVFMFHCQIKINLFIDYFHTLSHNELGYIVLYFMMLELYKLR